VVAAACRPILCVSCWGPVVFIHCTSPLEVDTISSTSSSSSATKPLLPSPLGCKLELAVVLNTVRSVSCSLCGSFLHRPLPDRDVFIVPGVEFWTNWYVLPIPEHSIPFLTHLEHRGVPLSQTILRFVHWRQLSYRIARLHSLCQVSQSRKARYDAVQERRLNARKIRWEREGAAKVVQQKQSLDEARSTTDRVRVR
jgi:hypothetical protein